jgi:hypothetical protein
MPPIRPRISPIPKPPIALTIYAVWNEEQIGKSRVNPTIVGGTLWVTIKVAINGGLIKRQEKPLAELRHTANNCIGVKSS